MHRQLARCMPKRALACLSGACKAGCMRLGECCAKRLGAEPDLTGSKQSQPDLNTSFIALAQLDRNGRDGAAAEGHQKVLLAAAGWQSKGVTVTRAPEPNDVYWENLELSQRDRRQRDDEENRSRSRRGEDRHDDLREDRGDRRRRG